METTFGGCACGAVRYEFTGEPVMMGHCQCRACQRDSGICNECGSPVASKNSGMQTLMFVRAASPDDPTIYNPQMVVWSGMGQPWDHFNPALPSFERMPPGM
jgi:hypothetical protein